MTDKLDTQSALIKLECEINEADNLFSKYYEDENEYAEPSWEIEACFLQLLALTESLGLTSFQQMILAEYNKAKTARNGFNTLSTTPDSDPYSVVLARIRCFKRALDGFFPDKPIIEVTKDVLQILRDVHYSITDPQVFGKSPENETDVHLRIEAILKCVFPDLKHKPVLTKQIKNFEPDTGIPSISTLIEYKFLSRSKDAAIIADEILADTRGYVSADWKRFIYVIYETNRFKKESEWVQLLRESGVPESTSVVVLSGVPSGTPSKKKGKPEKAMGPQTVSSTPDKPTAGQVLPAAVVET